MASVWDEYEQNRTASVWDEYEKNRPTLAGAATKEASKEAPRTRNLAAVANDTVITAVNSGLGLVKSISDFVSVDNPLSRGLQSIITEGEENQSDVVKQSEAELNQAIDEGGWDAAKGVGKYILNSPLQTGAKIVGNVGPIGRVVKTAVGAAELAGLGAKGATWAGRGAGAALSGAAGGGDAAADAYAQVMASPNVPQEQKEMLARAAARDASVVPALIGAITGGTGKEAVMAGAGKQGIRKLAAKEFGSEFLEEGATKASANIAAHQYDPSIDRSKGVFGSALMGGSLGGIGGGGVAYLNNRAHAVNILGTANPTTDDRDTEAVQQQMLGLGYDPMAGNMITYPDGSVRPASEAINVTPGGVAALTPADTLRARYPGAVPPVAPAAQAETTTGEIADELNQAAEKYKLNLTSKKGTPIQQRIDLFTKAVDLVGNELLTPEQLGEVAAELKKNRYGAVEKTLAQIEADFQEKQRANKLGNTYRVPEEQSNVGTAVSPDTGTPASVVTGSDVVSGSVAPTGPNAAVTEGTGGVDTVAPITTPSGPEVSLLGATTNQQAPVVSRKRRLNFEQPQRGTAYVAPETETETTTAPATLEQQLGLEETPEVDPLVQIFGERDAGIIRDFNTGRTSADIGKTYGLSEQRVRQIAGDAGEREWADKIAAAKEKYGYTDGQLAEMLRPFTGMASEIEQETGAARPTYGAKISEEEATAAGLIGGGDHGVGTVGGSKGKTKEKNVAELYSQYMGLLEAKAELDDRIAEASDAELEAERKVMVAKLEQLQAVILSTQGEAKVATTLSEAQQQEQDAAREAEANSIEEEASREADYVDETATDEDEDFDGRFGKPEKAKKTKDPYTAKELLADIKDFIRADIPGRKLIIVDSVNDLLTSKDENIVAVGAALQIQGAYGVATDGRAFLIADRINKGEGRAKFLHEVGSHLGLENLLPTAVYKKLTDQIEAWVNSDADTTEVTLAARAEMRVMNANTPAEDITAERLAYFIEEAVLAGIDPTATTKESSALTSWFRTLWAAFKVAIRKLGFKPEAMTAQDIVDLAFGAARLEMSGTFHGTAAAFRKFSHKYMNTGEGAQAFGWGSYVAEAPGVAKGYWFADVRRKTQDAASRLVNYQGWFLSNDIIAPDTRAVILKADDVVDRGFASDVEQAVREYGIDSIRLTDPRTGKSEDVFVGKVSPEGSLMRVDLGVDPKDVLDWNIVLDKQPAVLKRLTDNLPENVRTELESELNASLDELTGEELYRGLGVLEKRSGLISEQFDVADYNNRLRGARVKQLVSTFLDEKVGIPALKFLDQNSRGDVGFAKVKLKQKQELLKEKERTLAQDTQSADRLEKERDEVFARDYAGVDPWVRDRFKEEVNKNWLGAVARRTSAEYQVELLRGEIAQDEKRIIKLSNPTRNVVVFNDKNIFRVGSAVKADRQRMRFGKPSQTNENIVQKIARTMGGATGQMLYKDGAEKIKAMSDSLLFLHDLVDKYKGAMPSVSKWYKSMQDVVAFRSRIEQKAEVIAAAAGNLKEGTRKVNDFVAESRISQKWGYDPKFAGQTVVVDPAMRAKFAALSADEQSVVKSVFAHGNEMLAIKRDILKSLGLEGVFSSISTINGPYAPLKRFGNYVAVLKSKELVDAENAGKTALVDKLKGDPTHYVMTTRDTLGQAERFVEENGGKYAFSDAFRKSRNVAEDRPMNEALLQRVLAAVKMDTNVTPEAKTAMTNMIKDMYFQALDDHDARLSGLKSKNVAGYDTDMIRSFLSHARSEAGFLANLKYGGEVNAHFYAMQKEAKGPNGKRENQDAFNMLAAHYAESLTYKDTPIQDRLMALTSAWQLGTSIGYHVTNATQGFTTVAKLAADFNNYPGAWKALFKGFSLLKDIGAWGNVDLSKVKDVGLRGALQQAADMRLLDVGMTEDLTHFEAFRTGVASIDKASGFARAALHKLNQVSRAVEFANRVSAASAGYSMSLAAGKTVAQAQEYATNILHSTQGDFSRTGAPLVLKKLPKVVGQYKKFQLMMAAFYAKAYSDGFRSADPTTRAIGKRMLAYKLGHTAVAAGALGLPLFGQIVSLVLSALGSDDEPKDVERTLRELIGDEDLADLLLHGPLAYMGLDMSSKLGEDKIFSIMPYTDFDISSSTGLAKTALGIAGPSAAQIGKFAEGIGYFERGDYVKGTEKLLPKGLADGLKAFRLANEGYTLKNGDVMYTPDDMNEFALVLDAIGMPSTALKKMDWMRSQQYEIKKFYKDRTQEIERAYAKAHDEDDFETMDDLRDQWRNLQEGKVESRRYFNDRPDELRKQPLSVLLKYPQLVNKRERKLQQSAD